MARAITTRRKLGMTVIAWIVGFLIFFPILWTILTSFKSELDAISIPPKFLFFQWTTENTCQQGTDPFDPAPCVAHQGCKAEHPVVWCAIPGLGHDIWAKGTEASWKFFSGLL